MVFIITFVLTAGLMFGLGFLIAHIKNKNREMK